MGKCPFQQLCFLELTEALRKGGALVLWKTLWISGQEPQKACPTHCIRREIHDRSSEAILNHFST